MPDERAAVRLEAHDGIAFVVIDNPPVNALSQEVRQGLLDAARAIKLDRSVRAAVILCAGRTFIAGADIREFGAPSADPQLPDVIDALESLDVPVIAAIHGSALGGGFELALGCHYRIAGPGAKVGFPEVTLGLIPGCYRLPRLVGVEAALELIIGGAPIGVATAHGLGAIDAIVQGDLRKAAADYALELLRTGRGARRTSLMDDKIKWVDPALFASRRAGVHKRQRGQIAPLRALDAVEAGVTLPVQAAAKEFQRIFLELSDSRQALALRHVFFAEREVARAPGLEAAPQPVKSAAVIGAGAMGAGIATCFATAGILVTLVDISPENVARGLAAIRQNFESALAKGKMSLEEAALARASVAGATDYSAIKDADLVVEAVFEDLTLKKKVFADLDRACKPESILATNTSYLDIDAIAAATQRPEKVLGLHFFNPAHVMKLLEIVRAGATSGATLATGVEIARRLHKTGVVAGVGFGFIGNRMLNAYRTEALTLALEGASIAQIDKAMVGFGMPMGPFALMDLTGLEVNVKMRAQADPALIDARAFEVVDRLYEMGRVGQKSGAGFYRYEGEGRAEAVDPDVDVMIAAAAANHSVVRRAVIADEEIIDRCLLTLVNEGVRILEEGIAMRSGDIDVTYIAGYGFPRHIGGPMCWAEQQGLTDVAARMTRYFERARAPRWSPAGLLVAAASAGLTFDQALAASSADSR